MRGPLSWLAVTIQALASCAFACDGPSAPGAPATPRQPVLPRRRRCPEQGGLLHRRILPRAGFRRGRLAGHTGALPRAGGGHGWIHPALTPWQGKWQRLSLQGWAVGAARISGHLISMVQLHQSSISPPFAGGCAESAGRMHDLPGGGRRRRCVNNNVPAPWLSPRRPISCMSAFLEQHPCGCKLALPCHRITAPQLAMVSGCRPFAMSPSRHVLVGLPGKAQAHCA